MTSITRRHLLWRGAQASAVAAAVGLLAACGDAGVSVSTRAPATGASPAAAPTGGAAAAGTGTLHVGLGRTLQDLNAFDLDIAAFSTIPQIYEALLTYDAAGKVTPRLAESWTVAQDGSSATIKLRQGATFQNGKPVNADAVLANYEKAKDAKFAYQIYSIIPRVKDLTKTDDATLTLTMAGPTPQRVVTDILNSLNLMEPSTLDTDLLKTRAIGAGPFAVDSYTPNNQLVLKRYDGFWRKPGPSLQTIDYHISNDIDAQVASLQAGTVDAIPFLLPGYTARLKDQFDVYKGPAGLQCYPFRLNPSMAPFDNKGIRQGFQYAINRQGIVDKVFYGYSTPQVLPFGQAGPAYDPNAIKNYPFDLQKAKQLFEAAGAPNWSAVLFIVQGDVLGVSIAQIVQADLATIGVKLDVQQISSVESGQHAFAGDYQMSYGVLANCGKYPTWVTLNSLMRVQNNPVLKGSAAPILDRWQKAIDGANAALTEEQQSAAFKTLRDVILDESWLITICDDQTLVAMNKKVSGLRINQDGYVVFEDAQLQSA